jgi:hypothetical protein
MNNIHHLIELYCRWRGIPEPHSNTEIQKILIRMKTVGLVTDEDIKKEK